MLTTMAMAYLQRLVGDDEVINTCHGFRWDHLNFVSGFLI